MSEFQQRFDAGEVIRFDKPMVVLASASPRRAAILVEAGIPFVKILSDFDDSTVNDDYPHEGVSRRDEVKYARAMALAKLRPFVGRVVNGAVVACDTTILCRGHVLEKPLTREKCRENHEIVSGTVHFAYTAYAVYFGGKTVCRVMRSRVKVDRLPSDVIETICDEPETLRCAGYRTAGVIGPFVHFKDIHHRRNVEGLCPRFLGKLLRRVGFRE